jgi:RNA polymerase sigma-70 factor (ECF subfamily)
MMLSICDQGLSVETHVTLILRLLCGFSAKEIASAFMLDTQTIDRRLHRGRAHLKQLRRLHDVNAPEDVRARQPSVLQALYLQFNEGYHGSDPKDPLQPALCADALRLAELLLESPAASHAEVHALSALFCLNAARLGTRLDVEGVFLPLAEQDRTAWDRSLIARGLVHLSASATGEEMTRWHLEAGIAWEHASAPSLAATDWPRIVGFYDTLLRLNPSPIVAMNRALALAELHGAEAGRSALLEVADDERLQRTPFFWGALADLDARVGLDAAAREHLERAVGRSRSRAERAAYQRKLTKLRN